MTRSHTATHTLHWALPDQLGEHARQQGSLVDAGRLRFDFAHLQQVPAERLAEIEALVNRQLLADPDVKVWHGSLAEAEAAGALSLFGERYGSVVRVVEVGDFSRELCGGTHVGHGSQVGPVHVLGEASIGSNLRRIEALTGLEALHELGYTHAFQIDADGQHMIADIPRFLAAAEMYPNALLLGTPQFDDSAPKARLIGRKILTYWPP